MNPKLHAIANFLGREPIDIEQNDTIFLFRQHNTVISEYLVLTDTEATKQCKEKILEELWAFNADFIVNHLKSSITLNDPEEREFINSLNEIQQKLCESANPIISALLEDPNIFAEDAIGCDGRGNFLATYDGDENEIQVDSDLYAHDFVKNYEHPFAQQTPPTIILDWLEEQQIDVTEAREVLTQGYITYYIYRV